MTELPTTATMRGPWGPDALTLDGRTYALSRRGEEYWIRLPDPDRVAAAIARGDHGPWSTRTAPDVERRIVMTTGSHHYQAYWVAGARGNELWQVPFVYHFEARRFLPRREVFLQPPDDPPHAARWNSNCIQCHSVAGQPQHDPTRDEFATRAAELGIACEACHGPGAEHVRRHQSPSERYEQRASDAADPTIVNPDRLSAERASELCGQCHSYFVPSEPDRWWESGFAGRYRPGEPLAPTRHVIDYERDREGGAAWLSTSLDHLFYTDGTIRVGGREWNGLRRSACFERGAGDRQLRCTSCHRLHGGTRDDQLPVATSHDAPCTACHAEVAEAGEAHTHHRPLSHGSACVDCHMPRTTYALFKAIRSHRITRPVVDTREGAAPNACNLCHLDQSTAWAAAWLARWYGLPDPYAEPGAHDAEQPALRGVVGTSLPRELAVGTAVLHGDAAVRVIIADHLGWAPSRAASGGDWQPPLLERAARDPYAAVRFVARRSLELAKAGAASPRARLPHGSPFAPDGSVAPDVLRALTDARDPRPVRIAE